MNEKDKNKDKECPCDYKEICDYLDGKCVKNFLGKHLAYQEGYRPEDIKERLKRWEELNIEYEIK